MPSSREELWSLITNDKAEPRTRGIALQQAIAGGDFADSIPTYLLKELYRTDIHHEWLVTLLLAVEYVRFGDPTNRRQLRQRLGELAHSLRENSEADLEAAVFASVRRYASLLEPSEVSFLVEFLDPRGHVDTRLVSLKAIANVLELGPPPVERLVTQLADRVHALAIKFLDVDVFEAGENSAIAQCAVHALAVIGDTRVVDLFRRVETLQRQWFSNRIRNLKQRLNCGETIIALWNIMPLMNRFANTPKERPALRWPQPRVTP